MGIEKLVKHVAIGAAGVWGVGKLLDSYLKKKTNVSAEEKAKYKAVAKGAVLGGVTGDYIGEEVNNGAKYNLNERVQNIGLGAVAGAVGSYLILNGKHKKSAAQAPAGAGAGSGDAGAGTGEGDGDSDGSPGDFESS